MAVHKVKRGPASTLCQYCGEVMGMGRHAIPVDLARTLPTEKCPACMKEAIVACVLGLGHYFYVCESCGKKWSNIE